MDHKKYYKPASEKTGKGKFKNSGQKSGKSGAIASKPSKEKLTDRHADPQIKHLVNTMFKQKKSNKVPHRKNIDQVY